MSDSGRTLGDSGRSPYRQLEDRLAEKDAEIAALKDDLVRLKAVCDTNEALLVSTSDREDEMRADLARLKCQVDGFPAARDLLLKGMESQAELMDGLKQETRQQKADLARLRAKVRALVEEVENETAIPWAHIKTWAAVKAEGEEGT